MSIFLGAIKQSNSITKIVESNGYKLISAKTKSGKILRRLLKARELGLPEGDLSTLEQT